jgi:tetratricopeptide (TPR) repeat protein
MGVPPEDVPLELVEQVALYRSLSADKALVVFADDAESAAQVRPLLPASPTSALVITSRSRLTGLALDGGRFVAVGVLDESAAIELLCLVVGQDKVDREPAPARELVRLCGGLPIALRVAAARLSSRPRWSISRVVSTLTSERHRLASLTVAGEISVQASLDLSYRELRPAVARLYRLLGLHPGAEFGLGVATAAGDLPAAETEDLVADLVDVNLVNEVDDRYHFHDLLRLHAARRAEEEVSEADRHSAVRRMVAWYLESAILADLAVTPLRRRVNDRYLALVERPTEFENPVAALDWLERELPNLVAAQRRAHDHGWWALTWQLCEAMWGLFLYRKFFVYWVPTHELGIDAARRAGHLVAEARLTVQLGVAYLNLQRYDTAYERFTEALVVSRAAGDPVTEATAQEHLGLAARRTGRSQEAMDHFAMALAITEREGRTRGSALHLRRLGETLSETGRDDEAVPYLERAVAAATEVGDPVLRAQALARLGAAHTRLGHVAAATGNLTAAVDLLAESGSDHYHAAALEALADLRLHTGDREGARQCLRQALELYVGSQLPRAQQVQLRLNTLDPSTEDADDTAQA